MITAISVNAFLIVLWPICFRVLTCFITFSCLCQCCLSLLQSHSSRVIIHIFVLFWADQLRWRQCSDVSWKPGRWILHGIHSYTERNHQAPIFSAGQSLYWNQTCYGGTAEHQLPILNLNRIPLSSFQSRSFVGCFQKVIHNYSWLITDYFIITLNSSNLGFSSTFP